MTMPNWWEAPKALLEIDGHCGLVSAWMVLRHFGMRTSVQRLVKACRYTERHGVFTIGLAACLKMHGLQVSFCTDPDAKIGGFEKHCYARAAKLGILPNPALDLRSLALALRRGRIPIVLFNSESGDGHFSPLLGLRNRKVLLPLADEEQIPRNRFIARWSEPEILRQCIIAGI